jgi:hypothetical protein
MTEKTLTFQDITFFGVFESDLATNRSFKTGLNNAPMRQLRANAGPRAGKRASKLTVVISELEIGRFFGILKMEQIEIFNHFMI